MKKGRANRFSPYYLVVILAVLALVIKLLTFFPAWIEHVYVRNIYFPIALMMRVFFGWIPFSLGDIFYGFLIGLFFLKLGGLVKRIWRRNVTGLYVKDVMIRSVMFFLTAYIYFNLSWGLNYNRLGIAYQLGLQTKKYTKQDLASITSLLIDKVNENRVLLPDSILTIPDYPIIFRTSVNAYHKTEATYPFLHYTNRSIKKSNYGRLGNYLGFLGYYNPFTGEAQVNLTIPRFVIPFVSCHEIAHQLGYASESEANFVGYLAAVHSNSALYHYSAYFDLFRYANNELARMDTSAARKNLRLLNPKVQGDYQQLREYITKTENPFEPVIKVFYDYYLKANQQEKGVDSYNEVVGWLIAFHKKFGAI